MKKMLLSALTGVMVLGASLGTTTSCEKIENSRELAQLWALILESELQAESDYTPESWIVFQEALSSAEALASSSHPTLEAINVAITNLHDARNALKPRT